MNNYISLENFTPDNGYAYAKARNNAKGILLDHFESTVHIDAKSRTMTVEVGDDYIYRDASDEDAKRFELIPLGAYDENFFDELDPFNQEGFSLERQDFIPHVDGGDNIRFNKYAGSRCAYGIGEGLIAFCSAPILQSIKTYFENPPLEKKKKAVRKPENTDDLQNYFCELYFEAYNAVPELFCSNFYTYIFPPIIEEQMTAGLAYYTTYLMTIQKEFSALMTFCFDVDFYNEDLCELTARERFALYLRVSDTPYPSRLSQFLSFESATLWVNGKPHRDTGGEYEKIILNEKQTAFENAYGLAGGTTKLIKEDKPKIQLSYLCSSVYDILTLEFCKMLELNFKVRKCSSCGKYFVIAGSRMPDYCSRPVAGTMQTCATVANMSAHQDKVNSTDALKYFNKYYKRYIARVKPGTIKQKDFDKWLRAALSKRMDCEQGKLPVQDFADWMYDSFKNTKKRDVIPNAPLLSCIF